jgi:hypothetical protein
VAQELNRLAEDIWPKADKPLRQRLAPLAAGAAWNLKLWKNMDEYITVMPDTIVRVVLQACGPLSLSSLAGRV